MNSKPKYLNVEYPAYVKWRNKNRKAILRIFDFLVKDYGFSRIDDNETARIFYRKEYDIRLEIDKIDGLLASVKPSFAPDAIYIGMIHIIDHFSPGKYRRTKDIKKQLSEIILDDAEFYKEALIADCQPLLSGDISWWPSAIQTIVARLDLLSPRDGHLNTFQKEWKTYLDSL